MAKSRRKGNNMSGQGKLKGRGCQRTVSPSFLTLELLWFIIFFPFLSQCLFFLTRPHCWQTLNIYSSRMLVRQSCHCCTEDSPLCISQLSINLERLPLFSETIITCHDSLSVLISLALSHLPFHSSHPPGWWMLKIVGCGMQFWEFLSFFSDFDYSFLLRKMHF